MGATPEPSRVRGRTWLLAVGAAAVVLIVIAIVVAVGNGGGDRLPDRVAELPRLHTSRAEQLEDAMDTLRFGDVEIDVASYGSDEDVGVVLFRYSNLPSRPTISQLLQGAGGGFVGSGGTVDFDAEATQQRNGVTYTCLPFSGRLFPDDLSDTSGQICAWYEGDDVAVLMDARTSEMDDAVTDSEAAHVALG